MLIIPAIDLRKGKCVRLRQGDPSKETVFSDDPVAISIYWERLGAETLHVVDLDGAFSGYPCQLDLVGRIAESVRIPVQVGGGLRAMKAIEEAFQRGAARVVLGTTAIEDPGLLGEACDHYPGQVLLGIDARDGKVAIKGWGQVTAIRPEEVAEKFCHLPLWAIIYTDILKDGTLEGPNVPALRVMAGVSKHPLIASGGIGTLNDLERLALLEPEGIIGAIVGKALYQGSIDFRVAVERFQGSKRAISL